MASDPAVRCDQNIADVVYVYTTYEELTRPCANDFNSGEAQVLIRRRIHMQYVLVDVLWINGTSYCGPQWVTQDVSRT